MEIKELRIMATRMSLKILSKPVQMPSSLQVSVCKCTFWEQKIGLDLVRTSIVNSRSK